MLDVHNVNKATTKKIFSLQMFQLTKNLPISTLLIKLGPKHVFSIQCNKHGTVYRVGIVFLS